MIATTLMQKYNLFIFSLIELDETTEQYEAELSTESVVLEVELPKLKVIEAKYVPNKPEQMWIKGSNDREGYFTLKNPYSGKLLTGGINQGLIVKPGVPFTNQEFDFSGALPRGAKVTYSGCEKTVFP